MAKALIGGTFDPITIGHADLIKRAAVVFDSVSVVMFRNSTKTTLFNNEQRFNMIKLVCGDIDNVTCDMSDRLLVDYVRENNIDVIVKGVRNAADFDNEYQMAVVNHGIDNRIETLFIPSRPEHIHISSTIVREFLRYNVDISDYVTEPVKNFIREIEKI